MASSRCRTSSCIARLLQVREDQHRRADDEREPGEMVPLDRLAQIPDGKGDEHRQRDDFLDRLQLRGVEGAVAQTVGRYLQAVLEERDAPARHDDEPEGAALELEVTVPGKRHEDV